jgi:ComF family protein
MLLINFNNNKFKFKKEHKFSPIASFFVDLAFPKKCIGCGREKTFLCQDCFSLIELNPFQYCLCQKPQRTILKGKCGHCRDHSLTGLYSASIFDQKILKKAIDSFKYPPYLKDLAWPLAYLIILHFEIIKKKIEAPSILIPVPLFSRKERERGFNQSKELANILAKAWQAELSCKDLIKIKNTASQASSNREQRSENLKNAFCVLDKNAIQGKKVYLVDDIYTTGATMEECAKVLKEAGAKEVWGITVAREML